MVPLDKRSPLLKLPGAHWPLQTRRKEAFLPHQKMVCFGIAISILMAGFLASEASFFYKITETIHQVVEVQGPHLTSVFESQRALAELVGTEAQRRLKIDNAAPGYSVDAISSLDQSKLALAAALAKSWTDEPSPEEERALGAEIKNVFDLESELGSSDAGGKNSGPYFGQAVESQVAPFFDATEKFAEADRSRLIETADDGAWDVNLSDEVLSVTILASVTLFLVSWFFLVLFTHRFMSLGVVGALFLLMEGGPVVDGHLKTAAKQLSQIDMAIGSIQRIDNARSLTAQLQMNLNIWALTGQDTYWDKAYTLNSELFNSDQDSSASGSFSIQLPFDDPNSFSYGRYHGLGLLHQEETFGENDATSKKLFELDADGSPILMALKLARDPSHKPSRETYISNLAATDSGFQAFDSKLLEYRNDRTSQLNVARHEVDEALQYILIIGIATSFGTIGLTWAGLMPRIREYFVR